MENLLLRLLLRLYLLLLCDCSETAADCDAMAADAFVEARPSMIFLGDSITQQGGADGGWVSQLAWRYQRRADVLNRGFSGYNTRWTLAAASSLQLGPHGDAALTVLFLGANDAALHSLNPRQHVPLPEYERKCVQKA